MAFEDSYDCPVKLLQFWASHRYSFVLVAFVMVPSFLCRPIQIGPNHDSIYNNNKNIVWNLILICKIECNLTLPLSMYHCVFLRLFATIPYVNYRILNTIESSFVMVRCKKSCFKICH